MVRVELRERSKAVERLLRLGEGGRSGERETESLASVVALVDRVVLSGKGWNLLESVQVLWSCKLLTRRLQLRDRQGII